MSAETGRVRPWDEALAVALAAGKTIKAAAAEAGISERTARRRREDASFRDRVRELRAAAYESAAGTLAEASAKAAETLRGLLDHKHASVRLAAARAILDHATKTRESLDLEPRLAELETLLDAMLAERKSHRGAA